MNTIQNAEMSKPQSGTVAAYCLTACRKLVAQIERAKNAIASEFRQALGVHENVLRLALNEAEALAWETDYPGLVFPTLAREKAQAVAAWHRRQETAGQLRHHALAA